MNSLDGAVFMTLFMIAQLVAATISIETASRSPRASRSVEWSSCH